MKTRLEHNDDDPSIRRSRERHLEVSRLRRGTPEWRAAGQRLIEQRLAEAKAREEVEATARAAEIARRREVKPVTDAELNRAVKRCNTAIKAAGQDMGLPKNEWDTIAYDIIVGQCLDFRSKLVAEVKRVMLGIMPDEEDE